MRRPNWDLELAAFAQQMNGLPYAWGKTDCASLTYAAVLLIYDEETVAKIKVPKCRGIKSARTLLSAHPGGAYPLLRSIGMRPVRRGYWPSGAIWTMVPSKKRPWGAVGVVTMRRVLTSNKEQGVVLITLDEAIKASKLVEFRDE